MIDYSKLLEATFETLYMTFLSLFFAIIIGFILAIILYLTQKKGLLSNPFLARLTDILINVFRAIPYIILLILLMDVSKLLTGSILGANAAIPSLVVSAAVFFARLCLIAFNEVDSGTIEACIAMGASIKQLIIRVLIPESLPAIISAIAVTAISLVSYTAMAGAIGSGGLGNLAYLYGFARRNYPVLYTATFIIIVIVFAIQFVGDYFVKKIDKR